MSHSNIFGVTAANGVHFIVRRIEPGVNYINGKPAERIMVEFYDARYPHTPFGQFVSGYYASDIASHKGALNLEGGIVDWRIDALSLDEVKAALLK